MISYIYVNIICAYLGDIPEEECLLEPRVDAQGDEEELVDVAPLVDRGEEHAPGAGAVNVLRGRLLGAVVLSVGGGQSRLVGAGGHGAGVGGVVVQEEDDDDDGKDAARQVEGTQDVPLQQTHSVGKVR